MTHVWPALLALLPIGYALHRLVRPAPMYRCTHCAWSARGRDRLTRARRHADLTGHLVVPSGSPSV